MKKTSSVAAMGLTIGKRANDEPATRAVVFEARSNGCIKIYNSY
jgi:hypothetical protein